jgi:hypothetical protein
MVLEMLGGRRALLDPTAPTVATAQPSTTVTTVQPNTTIATASAASSHSRAPAGYITLRPRPSTAPALVLPDTPSRRAEKRKASYEHGEQSSAKKSSPAKRLGFRLGDALEPEDEDDLPPITPGRKGKQRAAPNVEAIAPTRRGASARGTPSERS